MKVKINVSTWKVGSEDEVEIEIDEWELDGMTEYEKEEYINKQAFEYMMENMVFWSWEEVEE